MATRRVRKSTVKKTKIVEGVKMNMVQEDCVRKAYRDAYKTSQAMGESPMELSEEDKLDLEGLVRSLVLWYRVSVVAENLCDCDKCGGDSDSLLDACPFCGDVTPVETGEGKVEEPAEKPKDKPRPLVRKPKPGKGKGTATGPAGAPAVEVVDKGGLQVAELDNAVTRVEELKRAAAKGIWDLGVEIKRIRDDRLWRLRTDTNGASMYKTFSHFVKAELRMGYSHANRLMNVAEQFDKSTMERIGIAKCEIMLHLPADVRAQIEQGIERKTVAQVNEEAKALKDAEQADNPARRTSITVAMVPGVSEIPLMARPGNEPNPKKNQKNKRAKSLADDPWGMQELPNKVHVYYAIVREKNGMLTLKIDIRRMRRNDTFFDETEEETEE